MKELIVLKDLAYAYNGVTNLATIGNLATGAMAWFNEDGSLIAASGTPTGNHVKIAVGGAEGVRFTNIIERENFAWTSATYAAARAKVMALGADVGTCDVTSMNLPTSLAEGDVIGCIIIDLDKRHEDASRQKLYEYVATAGDLIDGVTSANILNRLITKINADANGFVTAAGVDDATDEIGIKFTADTAGRNFSIVPTGIIADADVIEGVAATGGANCVVNGVYGTATALLNSATNTAVVASNSKGTGLYAQVLDAEGTADTRRGDVGSEWLTDLFWAADSDLDSTKNYDLYICSYDNQLSGELNANTGNFKQELIIALETGGSTTPAILAAMLGNM